MRYVELGIALGLFVLNYAALHRIIRKAGFSGWWIIAPLAPVAIWIYWFVTTVIEIRHGNVGGLLDTQLTSAKLMLLALFVNWVLYLVFAFRSWPSLGASNERVARPGRPGQGPTSPAAPATSPASGGSLLVVAPAEAAPQPSAEAAVPQSATIYCSWCGKQRDREALAVHHCGSRDRPPAFCKECGDSLGEGDAACSSCGLSTAQLSRH